MFMFKSSGLFMSTFKLELSAYVLNQSDGDHSAQTNLSKTKALHQEVVVHHSNKRVEVSKEGDYYVLEDRESTR